MTEKLTAKDYFQNGNKWSHNIARLALPIVLWIAKKGLTITYKQLAEELCALHGEEIKQRMTVYGWPAGRIGHAVEMLAIDWGEVIPPLNAVIVNAQTELPGLGADSFIKRYLKRGLTRRLDSNNRKEIIKNIIESVHDYPHWDAVAKYFQVKIPRSVSVLDIENQAPIRLPKVSAMMGGGPETIEHKNLKKWAVANPEMFLTFGRFSTSAGKDEFPLLSGDRLDAHFQNNNTRLAIEVKASTAPDSEIFRGVFQCVKYRATLRAMQLANGEYPNAQSVLLTTKK
ncbi:MAG TPA: hypothetical protein VL381_03940, partial [Rhodocyclaceae bacterium]|nr:hypothetical protein [Rhodocyclaceae bacterium]